MSSGAVKPWPSKNVSKTLPARAIASLVKPPDLILLLLTQRLNCADMHPHKCIYRQNYPVLEAGQRSFVATPSLLAIAEFTTGYETHFKVAAAHLKFIAPTAPSNSIVHLKTH